MKAFAIIFVLIQTCPLFCLCTSIEDYIDDPIRQCSANFRDECMDRIPPENNMSGNNLICRKDPALLVFNHHECYKTCIYSRTVTIPDFDITFNEEVCSRCIPAMTGDGTSKVTPGKFYDLIQIRSPGISAYSPNTICNYHVQCNETQSMMFEIVKHELQPKENGKCLDSLTVYNTRFPYDTIPTCGNLETLTDIQRYKYSGERMFVSFATNGEEESGGFVARVSCVSDDAHFGHGCAFFDAPPGPREARSRKQRSFRVPHFTVKPGQVVRYKDYTLTVESISDGQIIYKFENILVLQTYNQFEEFVTYRKNAVNREFPGFGKLQIGYGIAHYIQTDINPAFIPSSEERRRISVLAGGLFELGFFNDDLFRLIDPETPTGGSPGVTGIPPPDPCDELLAQSALMKLANESRNSCNGFLSATVGSFMRILEECRRSTTTPPGPVG
ncbi:uncharacterized protein LOC135337628 [Halichondria panicea]|uniref:uncharacterized protein LOC135337628 n=1 Tax=Halichondria panicea TaxID=6063 RepID=UPI00312BC5DF